MTVRLGQPGWGAPRRRQAPAAVADTSTEDIARLLDRRRGIEHPVEVVQPDTRLQDRQRAFSARLETLEEQQELPANEDMARLLARRRNKEK